MPIVNIPGSLETVALQPFFKHDCEKCTYLGSAEINTVKVDFYFCPDEIKTTLVYRFGDDPQDYGSTWVDYVSPLSIFACVGLSLYVKHLGANGSSGFYRGRFDRDEKTVLKI